MAPSSRLTLISPLRVWLVFNVLFVALVASAWYASYRVAAADNQRLIATEAATLTKARFDDIQNRRFRDFVEGAGRDFNDLYVRLEVGKDSFQFGNLPEKRHCSEAEYPMGGENARVTMCRPFHFSNSPMAFVLAVFLLVSGLALSIAQRLEKRTAYSLASFLNDSGVNVDAERGLVGILSEFRDIRARLDKAKEQERQAIDSKARADLAEQVAHDIRSPLAALDAAASAFGQLPQEQRSLVHGAVGRIRDIANQLLGTHRKPEGAASSPETFLLSSLIEPIVSEKRLQYRDRPGVEIVAPMDEASYGHFAKVEPTEFKRVLSNLIDNGVEALPGSGKVTVSWAGADGQVEIKIQDTGKGVPPELRDRLGRKGETHGKPGGSGLGLHHAKACVEAWGGRLEIASEVGNGTTVTVRLPAAPPPAWFVPRLEIKPEQSVVVLDDDPTIHQIWQGRLDTTPLRVVHFSQAEELREWMRSNPAEAAETLFLLDYQLGGAAETGLSLVQELGLGERAILVTSRFEDKGILAECLSLNVRMLPKGLAGFVPIDPMASARLDAVLIDDDQLVHRTWKVAARAMGKTLESFSTPANFLKKAGRLDKATPIYVDSELGEGVRGEDFMKELHAQGYRNLYLATGREPNSLPDVPWIKAVVGKSSPWT